VKRREFITLLGGAVGAWPFAANAQQAQGMRRIGVLTNFFADDPEGQVRMAAFRQGLSELGWSEGGNVRIDTRWGGGDARLVTKRAVKQEGVSSNPKKNC
jgi:putative ABC transport system substrate-binding protein